jgi:hypothetical protein
LYAPGANHPFTKEVMELALPSKFKVPKIYPYDKSKDLGDHVEMYRAHMRLLRSLNEIICESFPLTLKGPVRRWFNNLHPGLIESFAELGK